MGKKNQMVFDTRSAIKDKNMVYIILTDSFELSKLTMQGDYGKNIINTISECIDESYLQKSIWLLQISADKGHIVEKLLPQWR